jgi:hypothetical protein
MATQFNPGAAYRTITDIDGSIFVYQNGVYYDRYGDISSTVPQSHNGFAAVTDTGLLNTATQTITYDGDQEIMGNGDNSKFYVGGFAQNAGTYAGLLQNMVGGIAADFAHQYFAHNCSIDSTTGIVSAPKDPTSTSYVIVIGSDAGFLAVFQAPAAGTVVFNATPTYQLNLLTGAVSQGSLTSTGSIKVAQLAAPSGTPTGVPSATGGTVIAGSNYAKIVAVDAVGVSLPSTESALVTTSGSTSSIVWAWTAVPTAVSYQIWVGATGAEARYFTSTTNSYTQTAATTTGTSGTLPSVNTTGQIASPGLTAPILSTTGAITTGAGASVGTLTNSPAVGNPTKWAPFNDNGTTRYIPMW